MAVCGFVFYLSSDVFLAYAQREQMARNSSAVMRVQQELISLLRDEAAWSQTVNSLSGTGQPFECLSSTDPTDTGPSSTTGNCTTVAARPPAEFIPRMSDGSLYQGYDPTVATEGFSVTGTRCTTFNAAAPDPDCPFKFTFTREFLCGGSIDCIKPIVRITIVFDDSVLNALNKKIINIAPDLLSQPVLVRGIARVVTPHQCDPGEVVDYVDDQGVVHCQSWISP